MRTAAAASIGSRLLSEIEETNLDEILASLRTHFATTATEPSANNRSAGDGHLSSPRLRDFPLGPLNDLVNRHFRATQSAPLAVAGRHRELLYSLIATLIARPHEKAVVIADFEGRFDPLRLLATAPANADSLLADSTNTRWPGVQRADLDHVHILRPPMRGSSSKHVADCLASIEEYMLYGAHRSRSREWWGTVIIGGSPNLAGSVSPAMSSTIAVTAGWRGWLRVDRAEVLGFWGISVEEALAERDKRQAMVEDAGWTASSPWGSFEICRREENGG